MKLIDFGLAMRPGTLAEKESTQGSQAKTTTGKSIAGTLHFAAPEQMGLLPGVAVGQYSDVYGFGKTCYYALLGTSEPDEMEREELPESWRKFLGRCTGRKVANRLPDFAAVLAGLRELVGSQLPKDPSGDGREDPNDGGGLSSKEEWREKYPGALDCALWYRELLTRFHRDVPIKYGKGSITLYVGGRVLVYLKPLKAPRAYLVVKYMQGNAEASEQLTRARVAFVRKDDMRLVFHVDLQELKASQAAHEWLSEHLLAPVSREKSPSDTQQKRGITTEGGKKESPTGGEPGVGATDVTGRDVLVIAAREAWHIYKDLHAYCTPAGRAFRAMKYIAFYAGNQIHPLVPRILDGPHDQVVLERGKYSGRVGEVVNRMLDWHESGSLPAGWTSGPGTLMKVFILSAPDAAETVKLGQPIENDLASRNGQRIAFTQSKRYVSLEALRKAKKTSDLEESRGALERLDEGEIEESEESPDPADDGTSSDRALT